MSILIKRFQKASGAFSYLESLAHHHDTIVFRGHANQAYRLVNTWQRHRSIPHEPWQTDIDETLNAYKVGLEKLGLESFDHTSRFEAMEHARHHGVPTPCLDFSYSPYVALFFAFNSIRVPRGKKQKYSVVYALNIKQLAKERAKYLYPPRENENEFYGHFHSFQWPPDDFFDNGFPAGSLQFIPFPGRKNKRMQRQLGCLLYDTLWYAHMGHQDLEDYIGSITETQVHDQGVTRAGDPILTKVLINQKAASEVFERLELMNFTAANLYGSEEGVALDVKNAYNYNPKFSYLRDIKMPHLDDTKT